MMEFDYAVLNAGGNLSLKLVHLPVIPITVESEGKTFGALCDNAQMGYGILGRNGFFDYSKVHFDQRGRKVGLDPY